MTTEPTIVSPDELRRNRENVTVDPILDAPKFNADPLYGLSSIPGLHGAVIHLLSYVNSKDERYLRHAVACLHDEMDRLYKNDKTIKDI